MDILDRASFVPAYYQIGDNLKSRIMSGEFGPAAKLPTEEELAQGYGVARVTLRKALDKLSQEGLVRRLVGRGTFVADRISERKPKVVSILLDGLCEEDISSSLSKVISGAIMELKSEGCVIRVDSARELDGLLETRRGGGLKIDGVLPLRIGEKSRRVFESLDKERVPFVAEGVEGDFNWVDIDNESGIRDAFAHLLSLGHRRIGIGYLEAEGEHLERRRAEAERLLNAEFGGREPGLDLRLNMRDAADVRRRVMEFFSRQERPAALLCVSDLAALAVVANAPFAGVKIPDDLSVTGFEDMEACRYTTPTITTVRQDYFGHGKVAARKLLARMTDCNLRKIHEKIRPELITRGSTKRPV